MHIETLAVGPIEANSYIVYNKPGGTALVIDPGADADVILAALRRRRLTPAAYLLTHGHADHVGALTGLQRVFPAPAMLHRLDAPWAFTEANQLPPLYGMPEAPTQSPVLVSDGEERSDGPFRYRIIATPGHTPGGVCYYFAGEGVLFSGDTLFQGSVGRTDLPGGDPRALGRSLQRLKALPDDTRVFPGHGPATTIGMEKSANFFLRSAVS